MRCGSFATINTFVPNFQSTNYFVIINLLFLDAFFLESLSSVFFLDFLCLSVFVTFAPSGASSADLLDLERFLPLDFASTKASASLASSGNIKSTSLFCLDFFSFFFFLLILSSVALPEDFFLEILGVSSKTASGDGYWLILVARISSSRRGLEQI